MTGHTPFPWTQGRVLNTDTTARMSPDERRRLDADEARAVFANFSGLDDGKSREMVALCRRPEDAAAIACMGDLVALVRAACPLFTAELLKIANANGTASEAAWDRITATDTYKRVKGNADACAAVLARLDAIGTPAEPAPTESGDILTELRAIDGATAFAGTMEKIRRAADEIERLRAIERGVEPQEGNATFYSFRPSGKYYTDGRGSCPPSVFEVFDDRKGAVLAANGGKWPGLSGPGHDLVCIVILDEAEDHGFPLLFNARP